MDISAVQPWRRLPTGESSAAGERPLAAAASSWVGLAFVFGAAALVRLAFLLLTRDPAVVYSHPNNYLWGALSIVEHETPWRYLLESDDWHRWAGGDWTIAPLYYWFLAAFFGVFGTALLPVQIAQCLIDSFTAALVGALGRRVAGPPGLAAGLAYAVSPQAVELSVRTLTENMHTVLLVAGLLVTLQSVDGAGRAGRASCGGFLLGLSALARSVSSAFLPIAALWAWRVSPRPRRWALPLAIVAGGAAAIGPWTLRNVIVMRDLVPIETMVAFNVWQDNSLVDDARYERQGRIIASQPTPAKRRARALKFAWKGVQRSPGAFVDKVRANFLHFTRAEGLHLWLKAEYPQPGWRHAALILLDDGLLVVAIPLFTLFALAGPPTAARALVLLWVGYYLSMVVVLFHNEIRYRSAVAPLVLAGAAAALPLLRSFRGALTVRAVAALSLSAALLAYNFVPYFAPAFRALSSLWTLRSLDAALAAGDTARAAAVAAVARREDPNAARPSLLYGLALFRHGHVGPAADALAEAERRNANSWIPTLLAPRVLQAAGRSSEVPEALRRAHRLSVRNDAALALDAAWSAIDAPRTNEIVLGRDDYGAIRGFTNPRGGGRWTRAHAALRLVPLEMAARYEVSLVMGSPPPAPRPDPIVRVRSETGASERFHLESALRTYSLHTAPGVNGDIVIRLETKTWSRRRHPADQGVFVERMTVAPAR